MKTIAFITLLIASVTSYAQVRTGITAAGSVANFAYRDRTGGDPSESIIGFQAGLMFDAPLGGSISLRPQILYALKGAKQRIGSAEALINLNYIEVPVQFVYGLDAGAGKLNLGLGPYLGYAFGGNVTTKIGSSSNKEKMTFGSAQDQLRQLDLGLRASVGYELPSGLEISGFFSPGLLNISNYTNGAILNTGGGLSLGYWLGRR
ncbi:PorT family protein [Spirosoma sp. BT702]|uniref:PorT family protein n=1 Tax=Spirosoma profusum TaxID=2771354 RepID=A0A927AVX2_9BACT|nr:porin family protein [Spirosoma profusum]MBD2705387.1 PorT family protein [Spirosoma profusum]